MKKLISLVLFIAIMVAVIQTGLVPVSAEISGDYNYTLVDSPHGNYAIINYYLGTGGFVTIPSSLDGYPVTVIGTQAFSLQSSVTGVLIPDSVVNIEMEAFKSCINLTAVTFPASVETIDFNAFAGCSNLAKVFFLGNAPWMGFDVFRNCKPYTVFRAYYLTGSTGFTNPWQTHITTAVFTPLTQPVLTPNTSAPTTGTVTVTAVFQGDEIYREYRLFNGSWQAYTEPVVVTGNTVFYARAKDVNGLTSPVAELLIQNIAHQGMVYTINTQDNTAIITDYIGSGGTVTVPENIGSFTVTAIAANAFENTTSLTGITLPNSIISIGAWAFSGCSNLAAVTFGNKLATIGNSAFRNCTALTGIVLPVSLQTLGESVFFGCTALTTASLNNGLIEINLNTFQNCSSLTRVILPESLKWIQGNAFKGCTKLKSVVIPESVTYIGSQAFNGCSLLADVYFMGNAPTMSTAVFDGCAFGEFFVRCRSDRTGFTNPWYNYGTIIFTPEPAPVLAANITTPTTGTVTVTITYPDSKASDYDNKEFLLTGGVWTYYTQTLTLSSNTTVSARYTGYNGRPSLTGTLEITNIYKFSYSVSNSEATVTSYAGPRAAVIPQTIDGYPVVSIGPGAFHFAHTVTSVSLPVGLRTIQDSAFYSAGLQSISLPPTLLSIGERAFYSNRFLTSISFPDALESIGIEAFKECELLTGVFIPRNVRDIGSRCFIECPSLSAFTVDPSNTMFSSLDGVLFSRGRDMLIAYPGGGPAEYVVPAGVNQIRKSAFAFCDNLEKVTIGAAVFSIGDYAFDDCQNITIYCPAGSAAEAFAINNDIPYVLVGVSLECVHAAGAVIDRSQGFIYGLPAGLSKTQFESNKVQISGDGYLSYTPASDTLGTGMTVEVKEQSTGTVWETFRIAIFGDVNGDSSIDSIDAGVLVDAENYLISWDSPADAVYKFAGDVNLDGSVDSIDAGIIVDYENYLVPISQDPYSVIEG